MEREKKKARENIAGNYSASLLTKEIRGLREATVEMKVSLKFRKEKENRYYVFSFYGILLATIKQGDPDMESIFTEKKLYTKMITEENGSENV